MSYDLAVWADVPPFAGLTPDDAYEVLCDRLEDAEGQGEATPDVIKEFVAALLGRWPALGAPGAEHSPWAMGPEIGETFGPSIYITMTFSGAEEAVPVIATTARQMGLVCYDPQVEEAI